jgi:chromosome segregation ATPase
MMVAGVAGLLGVAMAGPVQAASEVRWGDFSASSADRLTGASMEAGNTYVLKSSSISVGDIEALQAGQKRSESELQSLKTKVEGQDRAFDEFKRKDGASSSSGDSQLSSLKRTVDEQKSTIDRQKDEIDGLKRSLDDLKRSVETLSNKVK